MVVGTGERALRIGRLLEESGVPDAVFGVRVGAAAAVPADGRTGGGGYPAGVCGAALRDGGGNGRAGATDRAAAGGIGRVWDTAARVFERTDGRGAGRDRTGRGASGAADWGVAVDFAAARGG